MLHFGWLRSSVSCAALVGMAVFPGCSCSDDETTSNPPDPEDCGNGVVDAGEGCDDGNTTPGDGCSDTCQDEGLAACGDGMLDTGEQCDDGNLVAGDGCSSDCMDETQMTECGNGMVEADEACDDANDVAYDGCEADCTLSPEEVTCETLAPIAAGTCEVTGSGAERLIKGDVLGRHTILRGGQVLVDGSGTITCVGCDCADMASSPTEITCPDGVVSPGLINAHEHITFIQNDPYTDTGERYEHRHDWRRGNNDHTEITGYSGSASQNAKLWGELRYIMGGATSIIGSGDVDGLMRNLDTDKQEGLGQPPVDYDTFPLGDSNGTTLDNGCFYPSITSNADISALDAYFPHVAEGIARTARNEFVCTETAQNGGEDLLEPQSAYIHAVGLEPIDYVRMADQGTSLIWSPRSNITLYGDTAVVSAAARLGVNIALGTDWIPTGSMNLQRELSCADSWNETYLDGFFTDRELWQMSTANAASAAAVDDVIGQLAPGLVADIAIFDGSVHADHRAVIDAEPQDTVLVMRGGEVLYGDDALVQVLGTGSCDTIDVCSVDKALCAQNDFGKSYTQLASDVGGIYPLFFCGATPDDEPSCHPMRAESGFPMYDGNPTASDSDGDGIDDGSDNCATVFNPVRPLDDGVQADFDLDGVGDACDECPMDPDGVPPCAMFDANDIDNDGVPNATDNCPDRFNDTQGDGDSDDKGDLCDACPNTANPGTAACPVSIQDIKQGNVSGVVGVENVLVTGCADGNGYYLQTVPGDPGYVDESYTGIFVYNPTVQCGTTLSVGDRVTVNPATVSVFFDQIQLTFGTVSVNSSNNPAPTPIDVLAADAGGTSPTELEGVLVRVQNVLVTNDAPAPGPGDSTPTNEFEVGGALRVNDVMYQVTPHPGVNTNFASLTGILDYRNGNQKLEPRSAADVVLGPPVLTGFGPGISYVYAGQTDVPTIPTPLTITLSDVVTTDTIVTVTSGASSLTVSDVTITTGNASAVVPVTGVSQDLAVTLTATLDSNTLFADVRVVDPAEIPAVVAVTPNPLVLGVSETVAMNVFLDIPARAGGELITLTPTTGSVLPTSVTVQENELSATFDFTAGVTEATGTVTADHGASGSSAFADVTVIDGTGLVINEVDYDQIGADDDEFVEIYNNTGASISLQNLILVLVNGNGNAEYGRVDLSPVVSLGAGEYLVVGSTSALALVPVGVPTLALPSIQNGDPDAVGIFDTSTNMLIDALSYDGSVTAGTITNAPGTYNFVEMTATSVGDSNTVGGSMIRDPNGSDTNNAMTDWAFSMIPTPGTANVP